MVMLFAGCNSNTTYKPWPNPTTTVSEDGKSATTMGVINNIDKHTVIF